MNEKFDEMFDCLNKKLNDTVDGISKKLDETVDFSGKATRKALTATSVNLEVLDANGILKIEGIETLVRLSNRIFVVTARRNLVEWLANGTPVPTGPMMKVTTAWNSVLALTNDIWFSSELWLNAAWIEIDLNITPVAHWVEFATNPI